MISIRFIILISESDWHSFAWILVYVVAEQILPKLSNKYIWWLIILSFNKLLLWKNGPKIIMLWCIPMSMLFTIEFAWPNTWQIPDWRTFISVTTYSEVQCVWILNLTSHKRTKRMKKYAHKNLFDFDTNGLSLGSLPHELSLRSF